jgi:sulfatase modifying factor 1
MATSSRVVKILVTVLVLCAALLPLEVGAQNTTHPLSKDAVIKLLKDGVSPPRVSLMAGERGIAFEVTAEVGSQLTQAGTTDEPPATLQEAAPKPAQSAGPVQQNPKDGLKYIWIPPGTFMMGCSPGDDKCLDEEKPAHQVKISKGFWIGQTDVTVGAYKRFAKAAKRKMPLPPDFNDRWANESMPIVNVTWDEARDFCAWAGGRLPSEAEWEYAARGGNAEARYGRIDEIAWHRNNSENRTHEGAGKRPNSFGLFDVLGNAEEWVNDWYDQNYYQRSPSQDPSGPTAGRERVLRGGSWATDPSDARHSGRDRSVPGTRSNGNGFRCVWEVGSP